ncbi:hypothetical protein LTS08_007527 [Lithohypha guttulata]|uniref:DUF2423 domain-containing protein n=1 Tax=Lithohypha guttulata TaxID=1690604 RepID=A0AAN7SWU2_9EURO|nr:hypothetical protein LTR51_002658 [Lithohypha guttulata]KAK5082841.1 hypothetical protein LTR05_006722 [Lithohypha guttulata]KAK5096654.1 hypothetical protein LTS08_007527 [Lithohypha guttulata]
MAKSSRASNKKRNNANLRTKVFGPAHDARLERLSAKLQEIANAPKPDEEKKMDVEGEKAQEEEEAGDDGTKTQVHDEAMQWTGLSSARKLRSTKSSGRITKHARRKPRNQVVFPSENARRKRQTKSKKG